MGAALPSAGAYFVIDCRLKLECTTVRSPPLSLKNPRTHLHSQVTLLPSHSHHSYIINCKLFQANSQ